MKPARDPSVLVIAPRGERKILSGLIPCGLMVRGIDASDLEDPADFIDDVAAVALLRGSSGEQGIVALESLGLFKAGRNLILVLDDVDEELLESAIARLSPAEITTYPPAAAHLRHTFARLLPDPQPGMGAVPGQRPATALLGVSQAIHGVIEQVKSIANSRIPVLVLGETGTGKEIVARAIHEQSPRANGPFVAVNCSALPDSLLESELFGFERGAFTGAQRTKPGLFEQAHEGTFFLDEIGDTSPALQVKLLRVLETHEIRRLGGSESRHVDVRIVSATHHDMEAEVEHGTFRQDLYFRLNTSTIYIPPLRRRRVDIPFLAQHFAEQLGVELARRITLADDFLHTLERREFPGNVRELRNAVERAIALAGPGEVLSSRHLQVMGGGPSFNEPRAGTLKAAVEQLETQMLREALQQSGGNKTHAAAALGLSRLGLRQKVKRYGLEGE